MKSLISWEKIEDQAYRSKVPGGWLVEVDDKPVFFMPDLGHRWGNEDQEPDEVAIVPVAENPGPHVFVLKFPRGTSQETSARITHRTTKAIDDVYPGSRLVVLSMNQEFYQTNKQENKS